MIDINGARDVYNDCIVDDLILIRRKFNHTMQSQNLLSYRNF